MSLKRNVAPFSGKGALLRRKREKGATTMATLKVHVTAIWKNWQASTYSNKCSIKKRYKR